MLIDIEIIDRVALLRMKRLEKLNALNNELVTQVLQALVELDNNSQVGCIVITGSDEVFVVGADIKEMSNKTFLDVNESDYFCEWGIVDNIKTPIIAAVSGYALGGGCELAMMCDIVYASESALFGQPEIKLGVIPGIGGTQRLTRLIGKTKAMDWILTGRTISAIEAEKAGLVARVYPDKLLLKEALTKANTIASYSLVATKKGKEAVKRAEELSLREGLLFERRLFHSLFATQDQSEGMTAFLEKRPPEFLNK
ncbi:enoyl-CoA hydratase/isomerase family protein [Vibrio sp. B172a]|uniref:enoyl-CoA hydratase-related protein n=1 Tax=Vibrio sp. B172a TaxID=2835790 RepID=UPI002552D456|nr:enoyl-CoA hydratase-related protein [Vibrio sp. B172a]MDK9782312.1 enoyl-CoA hydratase/isomerase family protein [Vibrio sp. B172a]